jgi:hypothetical protein
LLLGTNSSTTWATWFVAKHFYQTDFELKQISSITELSTVLFHRETNQFITNPEEKYDVTICFSQGLGSGTSRILSLNQRELLFVSKRKNLQRKQKMKLKK